MPPLTDKHEVKKQQRAQLYVVKDLLELSEMPQPDLKQRKIDDNPSKFDSKDKEDGFADFAETYLKAQNELQKQQ